MKYPYTKFKSIMRGTLGKYVLYYLSSAILTSNSPTFPCNLFLFIFRYVAKYS